MSGTLLTQGLCIFCPLWLKCSPLPPYLHAGALSSLRELLLWQTVSCPPKFMLPFGSIELLLGSDIFCVASRWRHVLGWPTHLDMPGTSLVWSLKVPYLRKPSVLANWYSWSPGRWLSFGQVNAGENDYVISRPDPQTIETSWTMLHSFFSPICWLDVHTQDNFRSSVQWMAEPPLACGPEWPHGADLT